jgi:NADH-quinone oxidoreductase subunit N
MAAMMAIFMLSLSGFPSTIGFLGKFYIFSSAVEANELWLAGLGIFTAFVSVYYYFRLIAVMYFHDRTLVVDRESFGIDTSTLLIALMAVMAVWGGIGTALIPLLPGADTLIETARNAISSLL